MPSRSKRNYRKITRNKKTNGIEDAIQSDADSDLIDIAPIKVASSEPKPEVGAVNTRYILSEVKWIGVVTGIVIVILIISYYFLVLRD